MALVMAPGMGDYHDTALILLSYDCLSLYYLSLWQQRWLQEGRSRSENGCAIKDSLSCKRLVTVLNLEEKTSQNTVYRKD